MQRPRGAERAFTADWMWNRSCGVFILALPGHVWHTVTNNKVDEVKTVKWLRSLAMSAVMKLASRDNAFHHGAVSMGKLALCFQTKALRALLCLDCCFFFFFFQGLFMFRFFLHPFKCTLDGLIIFWKSSSVLCVAKRGMEKESQCCAFLTRACE